MQTLYTFGYSPALTAGQNSTKTNWRMAYQQPLSLYKGIVNQFRIVVFKPDLHVANLTNCSVQVQLVDPETKQFYFDIAAVIDTPESGVATVTVDTNDISDLDGRFYYIVAKLTFNNVDEILYIDDNYGAFTPVRIEDAYNFTSANI